MDVVQLQIQFLTLAKSMLNEGILDEQFKVIQHGTDGTDPSFAIQVLRQYLGSSREAINNISNALEQPLVDFDQISIFAHQIKGGSSWIGARKVKDLCLEFKDCCEERKLDGCHSILQILKHQSGALNEKLEKLVKLELEILAAGGTIPSLN